MLAPSNFRWKNEHDDDNKAILERPRGSSQSPGDLNKSLRPATWPGLVHPVLLATQTQTDCCDSSQLRANGRNPAAQQIRKPACQFTSLRCATNAYQLHPGARRWWAMYHRHVVASKTFTKVDHLVWKMLWKWATRRHPRKNAGWTKARYFRRFALRDWIFACPARGYKQLRHFVLFRAETLPIQRHTKVRGDANPFDPAWASYFQRRSYAC